MYYARDEETFPMTVVQIDTSRVPPQSWIMFAQSATMARTESNALTKFPSLAPLSPRESDTRGIPSHETLESKLFDNAAELKIALSQIVMHLDPEWRDIIRDQLDALLDANNWQDDSAFITKSTFITFLRFIIFANPTRLPSLGVGSTGHMLAAWRNGERRIAVEFFRDDQAAATFVMQGARSKEAVAWRGHVADLKAFIKRNGMGDCLQNRAL